MTANPTPPPTPTPMEIMERLSATWFPDAMAAPETAREWSQVFADDVVLIEPASLPHGGRHEGLEAFDAVQAGMRALWEQRIEAAEYWPCGPDRVALRIVIRWTAHATGRSVVLPMIDLMTFRHGHIAEIEVFLHDTAALLETLEDGA